MPQTPTPGRALVAPALADLADGPDAVMDLALQLDRVASIGSGTLAARPAANTTAGTTIGNPGTFYLATDTGQLFLNMLGVWIEINMGPQIPIGASIEWGGAGDPTDTRWLLEDGRALNRTGTYATLFAVLSTTYGAGNGSTTFNIPDSRGRVSVGPDNMGTAQGAAGRLAGFGGGGTGRGGTGGAESVAITAAQTGIRNHTHSGTTGSENSSLSHNHSAVYTGGPNSDYFAHWSPGDVRTADRGSPGAGAAELPTYRTNPTTENGGPSAHTHNFTTGNPGGGEQSGAAHGNMMPYVVKNKIIRVV